MKTDFKKILIANRGEIAVRINSTLKKMGIESHTIHSPFDHNSLHAELSDFSHPLDSDELAKSYLDIDKIIKISKKYKIDAVHPGYGFLSENAEFVSKLRKNKIGFIGPNPESMSLLGDKVNSKKLAEKLSIPTLKIQEVNKKTIFPVVIKAAGGGGGRGMRIVKKLSEFSNAYDSAAREAKNAFNNDKLYVEKYLQGVRHIEVQIIADHFGDVRHLSDRDCSLQRNHQKVIEEAPALNIPEKVRKKMHQSAIKLCKAAGYRNLATVEFLLDKNNNFYFLEANTRLQVEHTVSEEITGLDFVELQIRIAGGRRLKDLLPDKLRTHGHAIQCRICAESPENNFTPNSGTVTSLTFPENIRADSGVKPGSEIGFHYDSLLAKLITRGNTRDEAIANSINALSKSRIFGITSNMVFLSLLLRSQEFKKLNIHTSFITIFLKKIDWQKTFKAAAAEYLRASLQSAPDSNDIWDLKDNWRLGGDPPEIKRNYLINNSVSMSAELKTDNTRAIVTGDTDTTGWHQSEYGSIRIDEQRNKHSKTALDNEKISKISSSLPGKIVRILVREGENVTAGQQILVLESMKMEHLIKCPHDCIISKINLKEGDFVSPGGTIMELENP